MNSASENSPYKVPEFEASNQMENIKMGNGEHPFVTYKHVYTWWSWHPNYAKWSRSCWGGSTVEIAAEKMDSLRASSMSVYHNKLVLDNPDRSLTVVLDIPCERMEVWEKIKKQRIEVGEL